MTVDDLDNAVDDVVERLPRRRLSGKTMVLYIVLPILVIAGVISALVLSGLWDELTAMRPAPEAESEINYTEPGVFYDLPDILVNLNTGDRRQSFLKMRVSLELAREQDIAQVEQVMPRIIDTFTIYLRELRLDDLRGSAGLYRLREELLRRVASDARPAQVRDVLFREMLVQ